MCSLRGEPIKGCDTESRASSPGPFNSFPKGGKVGGGGGRKLLKCEKDTGSGKKGGGGPSLAPLSLLQSGPLSPRPMVHNAALLDSMAPSGASCVKSRSAAEEKQIADLSSNRASVCLGCEVSDSRELSRRRRVSPPSAPHIPGSRQAAARRGTRAEKLPDSTYVPVALV